VATGRSAAASEVGAGRDFGLGVAVGAPISLVGKYYLGSRDALDFGVAFGRWRHRCYDWYRRYCDGIDEVGFNGDYLWQDRLARGRANLDWHIGVGARLWVWNDYIYDNRYYDNGAALAARMPLGLDLTFARPSFLEVFLEIAPHLYLVPGLGFEAEGAVGVRFYF
jgi:hypothetical protein